MITRLVQQVRSFLTANPVGTEDAIAEVVATRLLRYDPTDPFRNGFVVTATGAPGQFVVGYPHVDDSTPAAGMIPAWLDRARRVLRTAGYEVIDQNRHGRPVLVVTGTAPVDVAGRPA